jgi:hypothetical protein
MNQERAILLFNKFKGMRNEYVRDNFNGVVYKVDKVKLIKINESDYKVTLYVKSDLDNKTHEIDSIYAHANFKPVS